MKREVFLLFIIFFLLLYVQQVNAVVIPNSQIKTVEFFVAQNQTSITNGSVFSDRIYPIGFYLPENTIAKRYAWLEISAVSIGSVDNVIDVNMSNNQPIKYQLDSAGESQRYLITYPYWPTITSGSNNNTIKLANHGFQSATNAENAKLHITYEYDSTAARQLKTVRYFVGQNNSVLLPGTQYSQPFTITIPESGPIKIKSAFFEIEGVSNGSSDVLLTVNTTNGEGIRIPFNATRATQPFYLIMNATELYNITTSGIYSYTITMNSSRGNPGTGSGSKTTLWGARAVVTYEYDANSTSQLKTVRYFVGSTNNTVSTGGTARFNVTIAVPESRINVVSAFFRISGWLTAVRSNIIVNLTNANPINHTFEIDTEGSEFNLLYNATSFFNLTNGSMNQVLNTQIIGAGMTVPTAELYLTYNYSSTEAIQAKTVEEAEFTDDIQRTANSGFVDNLMLLTPETNVTAKSVYVVSEGVSSATATSGIVCSDDDNRILYEKGNTGESTYDYILHNVSATLMGNLSKGTTGGFTFQRQNNAITSILGGKAIVTYFFQ
jgi:hypothetical protein